MIVRLISILIYLISILVFIPIGILFIIFSLILPIQLLYKSARVVSWIMLKCLFVKLEIIGKTHGQSKF